MQEDSLHPGVASVWYTTNCVHRSVLKAATTEPGQLLNDSTRIQQFLVLPEETPRRRQKPGRMLLKPALDCLERTIATNTGPLHPQSGSAATQLKSGLLNSSQHVDLVKIVGLQRLNNTFLDHRSGFLPFHRHPPGARRGSCQPSE